MSNKFINGLLKKVLRIVARNNRIRKDKIAQPTSKFGLNCSTNDQNSIY